MTTNSANAASRSARLGLGTVQFGLAYGVSNDAGQVPLPVARAIIARALQAGITVLDTAAAYGTSEEVIATVLPPAHRARIVTKTLPLARAGLSQTLERARRSLEQLAGVDTLLVHSAGDLLGADGDRLWSAMIGMRKAGTVRRIGISAYHADDPATLAGRFGPDVMQVPISLLDQRLVADGTLAALDARGVEVHARSLFLQGLIFLEPDRLPAKLAHIAPRLQTIRSRIAEAGLSPLEACVGYALDQPAIASAVVGVTNTAELDGIVAAANRTMPSGIDWPSLAIPDALVLTPSLW